MNQPIKIRLKDCRPTLAIKNKLFEHVQKLERHYSPLISCRIAIEKPHRSKIHGGVYQVTIHLTTPGKDLFAGKMADINPSHEDVYVAIRDAFDNIERQLATHFAQLRREIKIHEDNKTVGRVVRIFPQDGYGFLETTDGRQIYFHQNSVLDPGFGRLRQGNRVRFVEELGNDGPQASTIEFIREGREFLAP